MRGRLSRIVFGTLVGVLAVLFVEGTARVAYGFKERWYPAPTPQLQKYHVVDSARRGHWTLQPGFTQTVGDAIASKASDGRVLGVQQLQTATAALQTTEDDVFLRINSTGYRGPELDPTHSRTRVLAVGDSCTFGTMESKTYPRVLQRELERAGRAVEVVNGGVEGYSARNVLLRMDDYLKLDAEIVTIYIGWNGLFDDVATFGEPVGSVWYSARLAAALLDRIGIRDQRAAAQAALRREPHPDPDDALLARARGQVPVFVRDVELAASTFRLNGSRVFLITLPGLFDLRTPPSPAALRMGHLPPYTTNPLVLAQLTSNYNAALRALAAREHYGLIDLERWSLDALQPRDRYFFDSVHLHEEGQEMVGRELARVLADVVDARGGM